MVDPVHGHFLQQVRYSLVDLQLVLLFKWCGTVKLYSIIKTN